MTLKLYYDLLSQPSRGLYMFFKKAKIPFEPVPVALRKGEHMSDEYKKIHKFNKVPAIEHNGFNLIESVGIMRYVAREFPIDDHWYPKDSKKQARVDEYLEWQQNNTRLHCAMFFQQKWLQPLLSGNPPNPDKLKGYQNRMEVCLDEIEEIWLEKNPYLTGNEITIADILGVCELEQPRMADYDPTEGRPKIKAWVERVKKYMHPYYEEANKMVEAIVERNKTNAPWKAKL